MSIMLPHRRGLLGAKPFPISDLFAGGLYDGFYFDFTVGATGAAIASITSQPPPTTVASQATSGQQPVWNSSGYAKSDGIDDYLSLNFSPSPTEMTLALCLNAHSPAVHFLGVGGGTPNRCFIGFTSGTPNSVSLAAGWGTQNQSVINDAAAGSIVDTNVVALLRGNSSVVELWRDGTKRYGAAPSGAPSAAFPIFLFASNTSGTPSSFCDMRLYRVLVINRFIPDKYVVPTMRLLGQNIVNF